MNPNNESSMLCDVVEEQHLPTKIDVLLVRPGMYPQPVQINYSLESLERAVDGSIEAIYPFADQVVLIVNAVGKHKGLELNRSLRDDRGNIYDILAGNFHVVGDGVTDFCSLSPKLMRKYEQFFHQPEVFINAGGLPLSVPLPDSMVKKPDPLINDPVFNSKEPKS